MVIFCMIKLIRHPIFEVMMGNKDFALPATLVTLVVYTVVTFEVLTVGRRMVVMLNLKLVPV